MIARGGLLPLSAIVFALALAGCQSNKPEAVLAPSGKSAALRKMERVAITAHICWFASKDEAFRAYRMSNELTSFSGRPRFLLVPAKSMESRPLLVVQAEGSEARMEVFGPLLEGDLGPRISADVGRWSKGDTSCAARA